jgi:hypothetical protein
VMQKYLSFFIYSVLLALAISFVSCGQKSAGKVIDKEKIAPPPARFNR